MAIHNFEDETEKAVENLRSYKKDLTRQSGQIISQLTVFKATYDEAFSASTPEQQAIMKTRFNAFKLEAKNALGL